LLLRQLEAMNAQEVRTPLQQRDAHRTSERTRDRRQVAVKELILQRTRSGGDDDPPTAEQRRREIGKGLSRAGARLDDQSRAALQRAIYILRHRDLLGPRRESRNRTRQRTFTPEDLL